MKIDISIFDNHLMNGLLFCKRVYDLFSKIRSSPGGKRIIRLRKGKAEKKLIEELIPIARYVQARYSQGRQLRVRWVDGCQHYDAILLSAGPSTDKGFFPKKQYIEVTTAVHPNDHFLRKMLDEKGGAFSVKGIKLQKKPKKVVSKPHAYTNEELQDDLIEQILERINAKSEINYSPNTVLVIQCFLDTIFLQDEWDNTIQKLKKTLKNHKFYEVFIFDSNYHYTTSIFGSTS